MTGFLIFTGIVAVLVLAYLLQPKPRYRCFEHGEQDADVEQAGSNGFTAFLFILSLLFLPLFIVLFIYVGWRNRNTIYHCPICDKAMRPAKR